MIEIFGSLTKEEILETVEHNIIPNTFVLENDEPFPGYHGKNLPSDKMPESIFLVITKKESTEKIFRISDIIRKYTHFSFDACPGTICIHNDMYYCIRIRDLASFEYIPAIQRGYMDAGIKFMKSKKINALGIISLKKVFAIERISDSVLKDTDRPMYYLKINQQLTWSHFKNITRKVKNNLDSANFDAALVTIYGINEVMDLVRVYAKNINQEWLNTIHNKYKEILLNRD